MRLQKYRWGNFFQKKRVDKDKVILSHKRIFILPTRKGLGFALLVFLLLVIAFVYNNNLAYLLCFLLASLFFISILHTFKSLVGLIISAGQAHSAYAGDAVIFDIYLDNPSTEKRFNLKISLENSKTINLNAKQKQGVKLDSVTTQRGWYLCKPITLSCSYPLGLFKAWSVLHFETKILVYPKPYVKSLPFPEIATEQPQYENRKGQGDFYGLRAYQEGDSIRDIHWKSVAKGQGLYSKNYSGEVLTELWLDYAQTPSYDTEQRLSQLCRWVIDADNSGLPYGFILGGLKLQPSSGSSHCKKCLTALALFNG